MFPRVYGLLDLPAGVKATRRHVSGSGEPLQVPEPGELLWSGAWPIPAIGSRVQITFNGLGSGTVRSYFTEAGWLGVHVVLDSQPDWHKRQNPGRDYALVFGIEVRALAGGA